MTDTLEIAKISRLPVEKCIAKTGQHVKDVYS